MGTISIVRAMAIGLGFLALAMLVPFGLSLSSPDLPIEPWGLGIIFTAMVCVGLWISSMGYRPPTDFRGGILLVVLWWSVASMFAAIPFLFSGYSLIDAYFEAASALTTTGAWLQVPARPMDPAGLAWRACLQWMGGLLSISIAASIIVRPMLYGVETLQPPFSRGERNSYLSSLSNALIAFWPAYTIFTALCALCLSGVGVSMFDSLILASSVISSSALIPSQEGLVAYPALVPAVLSPFVMVSGMNFILISFALRGAWRQAQDTETEVFFAMIVCVGVMIWILLGQGDLRLLPAQLFNAASLLSTNGMMLGQAPPLTVAVITALIGGAAVSTAGGFKILRWIIIMKRAREEIRRLISPNMIDGPSRIVNELGVWMHFIVFTLVLGLMVLIFTGYGHSFETAAAAAAATLSNTGPLLSLVEYGESTYNAFEIFPKLVLCAAMILGRVEAVVALALFNRAFWRS